MWVGYAMEGWWKYDWIEILQMGCDGLVLRRLTYGMELATIWYRYVFRILHSLWCCTTMGAVYGHICMEVQHCFDAGPPLMTKSWLFWNPKTLCSKGAWKIPYSNVVLLVGRVRVGNTLLMLVVTMVRMVWLDFKLVWKILHLEHGVLQRMLDQQTLMWPDLQWRSCFA